MLLNPKDLVQFFGKAAMLKCFRKTALILQNFQTFGDILWEAKTTASFAPHKLLLLDKGYCCHKIKLEYPALPLVSNEFRMS